MHLITSKRRRTISASLLWVFVLPVRYNIFYIFYIGQECNLQLKTRHRRGEPGRPCGASQHRGRRLFGGYRLGAGAPPRLLAAAASRRGVRWRGGTGLARGAVQPCGSHPRPAEEQYARSSREQDLRSRYVRPEGKVQNNV